MSTAQNHIIRRQRLEVEVTDMTQAKEWQERLSRFANGPMVARLSEFFDQTSKPNEVTRIERLEVTAEIMASNNWEAELLDSVIQKVSEALPERETSAVHSFQKREGIEQVSVNENLFSTFIHFLKTGRLSWSTPSETANNFEEKLMETWGKGINESQRNAFLQVTQFPQARKRLIHQFSADTVELAMLVFLKKEKVQLSQFRDLIQVLAKRMKWNPDEFEATFWESILEKPDDPLTENLYAAVATHLSNHPKFLENLDVLPPPLSGLNELSTFAKQKPKQYEAWMAMTQKEPEVFKAIIRDILRSGKIPEVVEKHFGEAQKDRKRVGEPTQKGNLPMLDSNQLDAAPPPPQTSRPWFMPETETYVRNAGMVILHPFLSMFFEGMGIAKGKKIVKPNRAIHLLQFLATGQTEAMEHELHLNKLLCGLPTETPIRRRVRLTKKEKAEAEKMLIALIGHWSALGNTTVEGLRGTFLCREGKYMKNKGGGWKLQVEKKAFDLLLAELPWSITRIQLPWMPEPLWVEW